MPTSSHLLDRLGWPSFSCLPTVFLLPTKRPSFLGSALCLACSSPRRTLSSQLDRRHIVPSILPPKPEDSIESKRAGPPQSPSSARSTRCGGSEAKHLVHLARAGAMGTG